MPTINLFRHADETREIAAGTVIFEEGDYGDEMFVVVEGEVELTFQGKLLELVRAGGLIGELALIDAAPRSAKALARTNCKLAIISSDRFAFMVQQTPYFALHVMQVMAERLRRSTD